MSNCKFIKLGNGHKKADNTPFYYVDILIGDEFVRNFVDAGTFQTIVNRKPEFLKDYNAVLEGRAMFGKIVNTLVDLTPLK